MASSLFIDLQGQPIAESETLGYGRSGVVIRRGPLAMKIPLRHPWSSDYDVELNIEVLHHEQDVYRRFGLYEKNQIDGVVSCIELSANATQLAYMENGDLRAYLETHKPSRAIQLEWFRQMARALEQIHDKRVLAADIATRNFLLDADLSVKICDFSEASLLPLETIMETANHEGFSIQTDIGQLGAVMYEIITGVRCHFDLFSDDSADGRATWPQRASLPSTDGLWLGSIIERCWTQGAFRNAHDLSKVLSSLDTERGSEDSQSITDKSPFGYIQPLTTQKAMTVFALSLGVLIAIATWDRKRARP